MSTQSKNEYDLIVLGGGSAGHNAAARAADLGLNVALIESAEKLGGLCILRGCMPTKTLIETANRMRTIRRANEFAIASDEPQLRFESFKSRVKGLVSEFQESRVDGMVSGDYSLIRASAKFVSLHELEVTEKEQDPYHLRAEYFIVATGSKPRIPDIDGLEEVPFWTSADAIDLDRLPRKVSIIGGGAIGMEFSHCYEGLGCDVTIFARSKILSKMDCDVSEAMSIHCRERGISVYEDCKTKQVSFENGEFTITYEVSGEEFVHRSDALLIATGRVPNTDPLNLEKAGVETKKSSIIIDQHCQTSQKHIFAAGDCASDVPVVHLAVIQGELAAKNINLLCQGQSKKQFTTLPDSRTMMGLFTDPEVVEVGCCGSGAEEDGVDIVEARYNFMDQGKGTIKNARNCFVKMFADRSTGEIIGACAIGPEVVDSAHVIQLALHQRMTVEEFLNVPFYHPTLVEIWSYVAGELQEKLT